MVDSLNLTRGRGDYGSILKDVESGLYFISLYWKGKRWTFCRDPLSCRLLSTKEQTQNFRDYIRVMISRGTFDPANYDVENLS